jgi:hypothetical protein
LSLTRRKSTDIQQLSANIDEAIDCDVDVAPIPDISLPAPESLILSSQSPAVSEGGSQLYFATKKGLSLFGRGHLSIIFNADLNSAVALLFFFLIDRSNI